MQHAAHAGEAPGDKDSYTCLDLDPLTQLSQDDQVQDDGCGQEGVLTCIVQYNGVVSPHTNLRRVLVHCPLAVTHIGNILDHNLAIEDQDWLSVLSMFIQKGTVPLLRPRTIL